MAKAKTKTKTKTAKLTPRQSRYVRNRLKGLSKRQAALNAGYSESSADNAKVVIEKPGVHRTLRDVLRNRISFDKVVQRIEEGLDAQKTEFAKFKGSIGDSETVIDFTERRQYAELAARLMGEYNDESSDDDEDIEVVIKL